MSTAFAQRASASLAPAPAAEQLEPLPLESTTDAAARLPRRTALSREATDRGRLAAAVARPLLIAVATAVVIDTSRRSIPIGALVVASATYWLALARAHASHGALLRSMGIPGAAAVGAFGGLVGVSSLGVWLPAVALRPRETAATALTVLVVSVVFESLVARMELLARRVVVVGAGGGGALLVDDLVARRAAGYTCVGLVDDLDAGPAHIPVLGPPEALREILLRLRPDVVVLAGDRATEAEGARSSLDRLLEDGLPDAWVVDVPTFYEQAFACAPVRSLPAGWFLDVAGSRSRCPRLARRALEVVLSLLGLVVAAPALLLVAWLVRRSGPGPVIYRQTRLGENGRPFEILKFRTMVDGAERPAEAVWATRGDPRLTRVGGVLRRFRLDELPQLWNVARGDMSIVGPRPERPEFVPLLAEVVPHFARRHLVKPGITGWAQIRRGYTADFEGAADKLAYDLWYVKHRSLLLDLSICLRTAKVLVSGSGSR